MAAYLWVLHPFDGADGAGYSSGKGAGVAIAPCTEYGADGACGAKLVATRPWSVPEQLYAPPLHVTLAQAWNTCFVSLYELSFVVGIRMDSNRHYNAHTIFMTSHVSLCTREHALMHAARLLDCTGLPERACTGLLGSARTSLLTS